MTVEEFTTKFNFKADTKKAEAFGKATDKVKDSINKADNAWTNINSKLSAGFQSTWFDQFSSKVTDLRRIQLFMGGIRRGMDMISTALPMLKPLSGLVTGITKNYNNFTMQLIKVRSAVRSFGILLGKTVHGIGPMVKSEISSLTTLVKQGIPKIIPALKTAMTKITTFLKGGFAKIHTFLLESNNKFLKGIGNMITNVQGAIGRFKGFQNLGKKIQGLTANVPGLGKLTSAFSAFGVGATAAVLGVVAGLVVLVKTIGVLVDKIKKSTQDFLSFEQGMKGVQRVTLASAEDMRKLEDAALAAGEASVFGVKDAAEAQKFLAMAGLEVDEVIGALPGTLQLAAAAEMDLATAADIATNIMSSNALEVEDLTRVNDILAFSASHSNQNVQQLGSAIQNIGPAGRLAALSVEDMSSWLSILANNGLRGEEAGTMVRNAIMDLVNPTDKMSTSLKKAGVNMSDFVDSTGKISNLNDLLMALQGMDEAARADFLGTLDARTYRALAPIITGNVEAMAEFNKELSQAGGTAEKMAGLAFQGLDGAIKEYKSKMEAANVAFIKDSGFNDLFEEFVRFGSATLPEIWRTLGLIFKPFVKILTIVMKVLRVIFTFLGGILKVINRVASAMFRVIDDALAPILGAIDQISSGIQKAFDILSNMSTGPLKWVKSLFEFIGKIIAKVVDGLLFVLGPVLFLVDLLLNLFLIILPNAIESFFNKIEGMYKNSFLSKIGDKIGDLFGGGKEDSSITPTPFFSGQIPAPSYTLPGAGNSASVGKIENNVTVQGGMTNEETGVAVKDAMNDAMAEQLRFLRQEVE